MKCFASPTLHVVNVDNRSNFTPTSMPMLCHVPCLHCLLVSSGILHHSSYGVPQALAAAGAMQVLLPT